MQTFLELRSHTIATFLPIQAMSRIFALMGKSRGRLVRPWERNKGEIAVSDNLRIKQPQDPLQVNIHEPWELNYWSDKWKVTRERIIAAVHAVGTRTHNVAAYLGVKA
jgi:hypothetical protein